MRRMFGGFRISVDGLMIGPITANIFYLKADDENVVYFYAARMGLFAYESYAQRFALSYWRQP